MSYDVHITRKDRRSDKNGLEITLTEWVALVNTDPQMQMRFEDYSEVKNPKGQTLRVKNPGPLCVWTNNSGNNKNGIRTWFCLYNGNITTKNPDRKILRKMWSLSQQLSAKVQGDEGEYYDALGNAA